MLCPLKLLGLVPWSIAGFGLDLCWEIMTENLPGGFMGFTVRKLPVQLRFPTAVGNAVSFSQHSETSSLLILRPKILQGERAGDGKKKKKIPFLHHPHHSEIEGKLFTELLTHYWCNLFCSVSPLIQKLVFSLKLALYKGNNTALHHREYHFMQGNRLLCALCFS